MNIFTVDVNVPLQMGHFDANGTQVEHIHMCPQGRNAISADLSEQIMHSATLARFAAEPAVATSSSSRLAEPIAAADDGAGGRGTSNSTHS